MKIFSKFTFITLLYLQSAFPLWNTLWANIGGTYLCATPKAIYKALEIVAEGDTILLNGGTIYELDKSLLLSASGNQSKSIYLTSKDIEGKGRYAILKTVGGKKEKKLSALLITGSFWKISKIEISGLRLPLNNGYWDVNGFRIGIYFRGAGAHHIIVEDVLINNTHNTAVAVRELSHHIEFRRVHIKEIGDWPYQDYNAHEGEGFYIGSSKELDEGGWKAVVHDIKIEDCIIGPNVLGQYVDIKYAASNCLVRNSKFYCEKTYNQEIIKIAGYANIVEGNQFIGKNDNLRQYILIDQQVKKNAPKVIYLDQKEIRPPSGEDNVVQDNLFPEDHEGIEKVKKTNIVS